MHHIQEYHVLKSSFHFLPDDLCKAGICIMTRTGCNYFAFDRMTDKGQGRPLYRAIYDVLVHWDILISVLFRIPALWVLMPGPVK